MKHLVVGISGASGAIYGVRLVEVLATLPDVETHLILTSGARATIAHETDRDPSEVEALADHAYAEGDLGAGPASGTFLTAGMVVAPCSMRTLGAIATSNTYNLLLRAADVTLKERRALILVARESPLHLLHLRHMVAVTEAGAVVLPPMPGFYIRPRTVDDLVDHTVTKILDQLGIEAGLIPRWTGLG